MVDGEILRHFRLAEIVENNIPGVTKVQGSQHMQACLVCLDQHNHLSGTELAIIQETVNEIVQLHWDEIVDEHMRRSWKDLQEATEYGAAAIAILLVINCTEYTIIERSVKGTGFDYWLLEDDLFNEDDLFPIGSACLEVSGIIRAEKDSEIKSRVKQKKRQTEVSDLPALIVVVEFSRPEAHMVRRSS